jgi:cytochrome b561
MRRCSLPLVGWTMLSAGGYTISLIGSVHLHPPVGFDSALFALMRRPYTLLALIHFLTILMQFGAGPFHAWVRRWRIPEHSALALGGANSAESRRQSA